MRKRHWLVLCLTAAILGIGAMTYRHVELGYPLSPNLTSATWTIQVQLELKRPNGPVKVNLRLPDSVPGYDRLDENFVSRGFGLTVEENGSERNAMWAVRRADRATVQSLYYRATVFEVGPRRDVDYPVPAYPDIPVLEEPFATALDTLVEQTRAQSADIETFAALVIELVNDASPGEQMALLSEGAKSRIQKTELAEKVLHGARIPTLRLNGLRLNRTGDSPVETWLAVHNGDRWLTFDPTAGQSPLPDDFYIWWVGSEPVAGVSGATLESIRFSVRESAIGATELAQLRGAQSGGTAAKYSLLELPVQTQAAYSTLLMVPIGAFVIILLRNVIGISTFGTFMPVLIAIAFQETQLLAGIVLFTLVTGIGLLIRFYLEHLRLLLVPRLSAVLTVVVVLMVGVGVLSHRLGIEAGLSITLFPMVILAMVIERMSIVWEERGPAEAVTEGVGSLIVAAMAYLVMGIDQLRHLVFIFPESMLILLALNIALGRYTGYRLTELVRFREFEALTTGEQPAVTGSEPVNKAP